MVNPFICGSGAFHRQDDDEEETDPFSPRKSSNFRSKYSNNNKNPYSNRGLDKFSALLAELEDKRKQIYTQMGPDEISFVRFVYSNCDDIKPIVVRVRDHKKLQKNNSDVSDKIHHHDNKIKPMSQNSSESLTSSPNEVHRREGNELVQPSCCLIILILALLAVFGRSFAVLCTALWWYFVPVIRGEDSNEKRAVQKQEGGRRVREKKIASVGLSSPAGEMAGMSPRRQPGHRKIW